MHNYHILIYTYISFSWCLFVTGIDFLYFLFHLVWTTIQHAQGTTSAVLGYRAWGFLILLSPQPCCFYFLLMSKFLIFLWVNLKNNIWKWLLFEYCLKNPLSQCLKDICFMIFKEFLIFYFDSSGFSSFGINLLYGGNIWI